MNYAFMNWECRRIFLGFRINKIINLLLQYEFESGYKYILIYFDPLDVHKTRFYYYIYIFNVNYKRKDHSYKTFNCTWYN